MDPFSLCCFALVFAFKAFCVAPALMAGRSDNVNNETYFAS